jgi:hypothetical protein
LASWVTVEVDAAQDSRAISASACIGEPQSPQNLNRGGFSVPHFRHRFLNEEPQLPQNFAASGFSESQLGQRIAHPLNVENDFLLSRRGLNSLYQDYLFVEPERFERECVDPTLQ